MPVLSPENQKLPLPRMFRARQIFQAPRLDDPLRTVRTEVNQAHIARRIKPGMRVAVAVGSRGIAHIADITRTLIEELKALGARPVIIPSMGSHGGGTAEGQEQFLAGYGITEKSMGAPIDPRVETTIIGETENGIPIHISKYALEADSIIPIARIKPHTDFRGPVESGLCKMLAIGLAKHAGCSRLHQEDFSVFGKIIPEVSEKIIKAAPVSFGLAIVENAYDHTARIEAVPAENFFAREKELLVEAKALMPSIMLPNIDVLVIEQIGKDISGAGMDPNIVGRTTKGILPEYSGPHIKRIIVLGISKASKGNAIGMGLADFTVESLLPAIDREATYTNCIASANPEAGRIPIALADENEALRASISGTPGVDVKKPRVVRIASTLALEYISVSECMLDEVLADKRFELLDSSTSQ